MFLCFTKTIPQFSYVLGVCTFVPQSLEPDEGTTDGTETEVEEMIGDYLKRTPFLPDGKNYKVLKYLLSFL